MLRWRRRREQNKRNTSLIYNGKFNDNYFTIQNPIQSRETLDIFSTVKKKGDTFIPPLIF